LKYARSNAGEAEDDTETIGKAKALDASAWRP